MKGFSPHLPLTIDPVDGYALTKTYKEVISQNLKNLVLTAPGERMMIPEFGVGIRRFLFEQYTPDLKLAVQNEITDTISFWLPFVEIKNLQIHMGTDTNIGRNTMNIKIDFNITRDPNTLTSVQIEIGE